MALSIVVNGGGTFSASMEEGPVSFTASLGAVPGPQGPTGATGPTGVVAATAPILYNAETQTVSIDPYPILTGVELTNGVTTTVVNGSGITFGDDTTQTTAFIGEARKEILTARNNTGSTIAAGKVVYLSGATGNKPTVALALATSESTSARTIGITAEAIANNAEGKVVISGAVENIDTNSFNAGDVVYLSSSTAGGLQTTLPAAPLHGVVVGIVTRKSNNQGSIEVFVQNYQELHELSDVSVADRANNDGLFYNSSAGVWQARTIAEVLGYTPANNASLASYAPLASPTFTGTVTIPEGASISGFLTTATAASTYAPLASPTFTGDPKAPTPSTSDNDTSIATTAFVNAYCPAASTTVAGKVELATMAEAEAKSSTTLAVTPASLADYLVAPQVCIPDISGSTAVTSVGTTVVSAAGIRLNFAAAGSASGQTAARVFGSSSNATGVNYLYRGETNPTLDKRTLLAARLRLQTQANVTWRFNFGKLSTGAVGNLADKGFGLRVIGTGAVELQVHNGTTLTNVSSSFTPTSSSSFDAVIENVGDGNVNLYINDSLVATSSAGGTGDYTSTTIPVIWVEGELTGALSGNVGLISNNIFLSTVS